MEGTALGCFSGRCAGPRAGTRQRCRTPHEAAGWNPSSSPPSSEPPGIRGLTDRSPAVPQPAGRPSRSHPGAPWPGAPGGIAPPVASSGRQHSGGVKPALAPFPVEHRLGPGRGDAGIEDSPRLDPARSREAARHRRARPATHPALCRGAAVFRAGRYRRTPVKTAFPRPCTRFLATPCNACSTTLICWKSGCFLPFSAGFPGRFPS